MITNRPVQVSTSEFSEQDPPPRPTTTHASLSAVFILIFLLTEFKISWKLVTPETRFKG